MSADIKLNRRLASYLHKRLKEIDFNKVKDGRRGKVTWKLPVLLKSVIVGIMAGCKGLAEVESMTKNTSKFMQKILRFFRRIPDTTMRDAIVKIPLNSLRLALHDTIHTAHRRKAIAPVGLPFGVVACDGKKTSTRIKDEQYAQKVSEYEGETPAYTVGSITCCLTSAGAKPCIDAIPLPASTNETGILPMVINELINTYGEKFFKMVTYDAGGCSKSNAEFIASKNLYYLFSLKNDQPTIYKKAVELLGSLSAEEAKSETIDKVSGERTVRRIWFTTAMEGFHDWKSLKMVIRVESETFNLKTGEIKESFNRYFVTNAPLDTMTAKQWMQVIRDHWAVENNCHNTYDKILEEDERPFILEPSGMLAVMILRRLAYNLLTLFRTVTQRSAKNRQKPWKTLIRELYIVLITFEYMDLAPKSSLFNEFETS